MKPLFETMMPCQIALICKDVEAAKQEYARMWGVPVPPTCDGGAYEVTGCEYKGNPAPTSSCKMAFFELGTIQFEIIEPYGGASTWQDYLDETGGGLHHIAYNVKDIDESIRECEAFGMQLTQYGKYNDASGAYAYLDARKQLGCYIELLCTFADK